MRKPRPVFFLLLALAACAEISPQSRHLNLTPVSFDDLQGWSDDRQSEALPALSRSCAALAKKPQDAAFGDSGHIHDWQPACAALARVSPGDDNAARAFFENYFQPYAAAGNDSDEGLFTGYYEAELRGSLHRTRRYHVPLYARPRDLVHVDLGRFRPEWKGQSITGKVDHAELVPYDDRAAIAKDSLKHRARVLVWVDDPLDAFFLEIQGSGRIRLPNGHILRIGYDGTNGRAYTAIGRVLADMNAIEKPVTMQKIRAWLAEHPDHAREILNRNASYVFFRRMADNAEGPPGAEGVALTPLRSLAVDPAFVSLGIPLWLDTGDASGAPLRRLLVAQDTGGAIKGPVRGDVFWGAGKEAEAAAGAMQSHGRYFILLPKNVSDADQR